MASSAKRVAAGLAEKSSDDIWWVAPHLEPSPSPIACLALRGRPSFPSSSRAPTSTSKRSRQQLGERGRETIFVTFGSRSDFPGQVGVFHAARHHRWRHTQLVSMWSLRNTAFIPRRHRASRPNSQSSSSRHLHTTSSFLPHALSRQANPPMQKRGRASRRCSAVSLQCQAIP